LERRFGRGRWRQRWQWEEEKEREEADADNFEEKVGFGDRVRKFEWADVIDERRGKSWTGALRSPPSLLEQAEKVGAGAEDADGSYWAKG
jgi:hypothetical protein